MAEMLSDAGMHELALEWCQAGLDRVALAGDVAEMVDYRRGLLLTRSFPHEELGIELDDEDRAIRAQSDASLEAIRSGHRHATTCAGATLGASTRSAVARRPGTDRDRGMSRVRIRSSTW